MRFEIVAALWAGAADSRAPDWVNLGDTLRRLSSEHNSFDGRFRRLLTCDRDEIAPRVGPVVRAAQAQGVPVSYVRLLTDLLCWGDDVKLRWAKSFWGAAEAEAAVGAINPALLDAGETTDTTGGTPVPASAEVQA